MTDTPTDDEREALRDAIDHVEGGIDFQDAISSDALRVLISAARRSLAIVTANRKGSF